MEVLSEIFSHLCGRGRCFVSGGEPLPLCQRCLGLYVGAAATAIWLAASGLWRRGLPSRPVLLGHLAMLAAGILGGLHVIDAGPAWRVACGLWTGHVAAAWLLGGALALWRPQRPLPWRRRDEFRALAAGPVLGALALAVPHLMLLGAAIALDPECLAGIGRLAVQRHLVRCGRRHAFHLLWPAHQRRVLKDAAKRFRAVAWPDLLGPGRRPCRRWPG